MHRNEERIHANVGTECNNNCIFCMEEDRNLRRIENSRNDRHTLKKLLRENAWRKKVMFTSGEPTLRRDLFQLIRDAKNFGFSAIGITTNGRMLAYYSFARRLLAEGVNEIVFSLHAHNAKLGNRLSRTPESFQQAEMALSNLSRLKQEYRFKFLISTVVQNANLPYLGELLGYLNSFPIDEWVLNSIRPDGRAEKLFKSLVPRYFRVAEAFCNQFGKRNAPCGFAIYLVDFPPCVLRKVPVQFHGFLEKRILGMKVADDGARMKIESCSECRHGITCGGIYQNYIKNFGRKEFAPVR